VVEINVMVAVVSPNSKCNSVIARWSSLFISSNKRVDHLALMENNPDYNADFGCQSEA
jgi:hypothetical protein